MKLTGTAKKFSVITAGASYFLLLTVLWAVAGGYILWQEQDRGVYRAINEQHTTFGDHIFPYITHIGEATVILPCLLLLFLIRRFRNKWMLLAMAACNIVPFLATQLVKGWVNAPRPLKYFQEAAWIHRVTGQPVNYDHSFPSGHSEGSFALLCFLTLLLPKSYRWVGILTFITGLAVLYSRIYLSQHFYRDVYAGSLIGTFCCVLLFWLIRPLQRAARGQ